MFVSIFPCSINKPITLLFFLFLFIFFLVSSCITTYKKTPPPVPPRTTTKPFISITAQSSTESAQDAYMDGHGQRGDIISQSGLSNSTESLDSMKALTAAIEAANAQIHGPASQHVGNNTATVTTTTTIATVAVEDRKKDHFKKNRCLSIGIQVAMDYMPTIVLDFYIYCTAHYAMLSVFFFFSWQVLM